MTSERRNEIAQSRSSDQLSNRRSPSVERKPFEISKRQVYEAYKTIKANKGGAGVDDQTLQAFDQDLGNNLYRLWNRLASGSYFPSAVKRVDIPKGSGGTRPLGIPTVSDRIAQMVVKQSMELSLERLFHPDSYGYRPYKSAHMALAVVKHRNWKRPWVLELDIKGFFDAIDHRLLQKAVDKHITEPWQKLYIERWLTAPVLHADGKLEQRTRGTPQGGVISPLLANLFLHYVFDTWVERHWNQVQFVRYADDIICHCRSQQEAKALKQRLEQRFNACHLELHPEKTRIAYCKTQYKQQPYKIVSFDFLGHTFKPRSLRKRKGGCSLSFLPAISQKVVSRIYAHVKATLPDPQKADIHDVARVMHKKVTGWINYYGKFETKQLKQVLFHLDRIIVQWLRKKYKRLRFLSRAFDWFRRLRRQSPNLFTHWQFAYQKVGQ